MSTQLNPNVAPFVPASLTAGTSAQTRALQEIVEATGRIFGAPPAIRTDHDPEHPSEPYLVLVVDAEGDVPRLLDLEDQWVAAVREPHQHWPGLRFLIRPK
jgi:hypothetical protein